MTNILLEYGGVAFTSHIYSNVFNSMYISGLPDIENSFGVTPLDLALRFGIEAQKISKSIKDWRRKHNRLLRKRVQRIMSTNALPNAPLRAVLRLSDLIADYAIMVDPRSVTKSEEGKDGSGKRRTGRVRQPTDRYLPENYDSRRSAKNKVTSSLGKKQRRIS